MSAERKAVVLLADLEELRQAVGEDPEGDRAVRRIVSAVAELIAQRDRLLALVNSPELRDFSRGVMLEAAHQRERWGHEHDAGKTPADWFWLVGYLAGKALHAHAAGNAEKAQHHTISSAAAIANWHGSILGTHNMRPGIDGEAALAAVRRGASS